MTARRLEIVRDFRVDPPDEEETSPYGEEWDDEEWDDYRYGDDEEEEDD